MLFRENGIDYDKVNYFNEAFTVESLAELIAKTRLRPFDLLRKGDSSVKDRGIAADTPDEQVIALMVGNPNTIQRPIVEVGDKAVLARRVEKALEFLNEIRVESGESFSKP